VKRPAFRPMAVEDVLALGDRKTPPMPASEDEWAAHWAFYQLTVSERDEARVQLDRADRLAKLFAESTARDFATLDAVIEAVRAFAKDAASGDGRARWCAERVLRLVSGTESSGGGDDG